MKFQRTEQNYLFGDTRVDQQITADRIVEWGEGGEGGWDCERDHEDQEEPEQFSLLKNEWKIVE